eukprot:NODE_798_length_4139_cov_0.212871.p2 type:complete len:118 gc:universal NODE_798_length_4139_cov_0.212871:496-143(-)
MGLYFGLFYGNEGASVTWWKLLSVSISGFRFLAIMVFLLLTIEYQRSLKSGDIVVYAVLNALDCMFLAMTFFLKTVTILVVLYEYWMHACMLICWILLIYIFAKRGVKVDDYSFKEK